MIIMLRAFLALKLEEVRTKDLHKISFCFCVFHADVETKCLAIETYKGKEVIVVGPRC